MRGKNSSDKIEKRGNILDIWSTSSNIKSKSPKESGTCLLQSNYIITFHHLQISNKDLVRDKNILMEALPRYRKTFLFLTFPWIVFSFFLLLALFVVEALYLSENLYLRGKACQLAVLNFNNSPISHTVALKCGSAKELVISVTLNSVGKPQPMSVPCFNWWTWQERTALCKPTGHMAV